MSQLEHLLTLARTAQQAAYARYSHFRVGASIRTTNNQFFAGCNVENASFSITMCAESSAIGAMVTAGELKIAEMLVIGSSQATCTPCGRCRQQIAEFADPSTPIHMCNQEGSITTLTLAELLPFAFNHRHLENS